VGAPRTRLARQPCALGMPLTARTLPLPVQRVAPIGLWGHWTPRGLRTDRPMGSRPVFTSLAHPRTDSRHTRAVTHPLADRSRPRKCAIGRCGHGSMNGFEGPRPHRPIDLRRSGASPTHRPMGAGAGSRVSDPSADGCRGGVAGFRPIGRSLRAGSAQLAGFGTSRTRATRTYRGALVGAAPRAVSAPPKPGPKTPMATPRNHP
jgi:hypothetical protein